MRVLWVQDWVQSCLRLSAWDRQGSAVFVAVLLRADYTVDELHCRVWNERNLYVLLITQHKAFLKWKLRCLLRRPHSSPLPFKRALLSSVIKIHDERCSPVCMINSTPGVHCYSLCLCPTSECAQFFGGPRQRRAWGPFNYTLSVDAHPSISLGSGAEQSVMTGLRSPSESYLYKSLHMITV